MKGGSDENNTYALNIIEWYSLLSLLRGFHLMTKPSKLQPSQNNNPKPLNLPGLSPASTSKIISVSRRTDIPAFYGEWFMNRLEGGQADYLNSFGGQRHSVSLKPEDVNCFVFWSKNYAPFIDKLKLIEAMGYNFYFNFTITGLPNIFECNLVETDVAIETLKTISQMYSPKHVNWRYDPIVLSDKTDFSFHLKRFEELASKLEGSVERCYFSFLNLGQHKKVVRNIEKFHAETGICIIDPVANQKIELTDCLADIAEKYGISMYACCEDLLVIKRIKKARCVDGEIIRELFHINYKRDNDSDTTRTGCGCAPSTDIGIYDTCPHGCVYCYANVNKKKAQASYDTHESGAVMMAKPKVKIRTISGNKPILLIAPHGLKDDDTNTEKLTRLMAERLNCYAVINEYYLRPRVKDPKTGKMKPGGPPDPKNEQFDVNNLIHIDKRLKKEFIQPILNFKNKITATEEATVVLIHGMDDKNAKDANGKDLDIFIGIGLDDPKNIPLKNRLTIPEAQADQLKTILGDLEKPITAEIFKGTDGYSGWDRNNLNQLFTKRNKTYLDTKVQSIQLEIKKKGFRDTKENIESTAKRLSDALAELLNLDLDRKESVEEAQADAVVLPSTQTAEKTNAVALVVTEEIIDTALVEEATQELTNIFYAKVEDAMLEIGKYLVDTFYGGEYERARDNKPVKNKSFHYLIQHIRKNDPNAPSQAWLYRSIQIVVEDADMEKLLKNDFYTYRNLSLSHKVLLLPINDPELKKQLTQEISDKKYTVVQFRERLGSIEGKPTPELPAPKSITDLISKPEQLFSPDFSPLIDDKSIATLTPRRIKSLRTKAQEQKELIEQKIATQQAYLERYADLIQRLETATQQKSPGKENKATEPDNEKTDA